VSDAWQKGAQKLTSTQRYNFYNDPLNLLAVDGPTNSRKSDSDAASWLPPRRAYWCPYVARQIAVKYKYKLWVTKAERDSMVRVLKSCPDRRIPAG
ncbi:MAG: HNH endonuclease family protein, partial [bacterium]